VVVPVKRSENKEAMRKMSENQKDAVKLVAVGDVFIGAETQDVGGAWRKTTRTDPDTAFPHVSPLFKKADISFFNLESALSEKGKLARAPLGWRSSPRMISGLVSAGFSCANVANNHIMDFGPEAFVDTLDLLNKNKIPYFGGGKNISEARKPALLERKKIHFAFLGYTMSIGQPHDFKAGDNSPGVAALMVSPLYAPPHINDESLEMMTEDVKNVASMADITIFSFHSSFTAEIGGSHSLALYQIGACHAAVDAGADLVLGHGSHLLQGIEIYKGKVICYGLGQFLSDIDIPQLRIKESIMLTCEISGKKIRKVSFLPTAINEQNQPQLLSPEDERCHRIQNVMEKLSRRFGTTFRFEGAEGVLTLGSD
jgi:poly-gamma-glutamate capsule biosynthesis protein CapA/YwtB (metallophosphatase superfamily)